MVRRSLPSLFPDTPKGKQRANVQDAAGLPSVSSAQQATNATQSEYNSSNVVATASLLRSSYDTILVFQEVPHALNTINSIITFGVLSLHCWCFFHLKTLNTTLTGGDNVEAAAQPGPSAGPGVIQGESRNSACKKSTQVVLRGRAGHVILPYVFFNTFLKNMSFPHQLYYFQYNSGL